MIIKNEQDYYIYFGKYKVYKNIQSQKTAEI